MQRSRDLVWDGLLKVRDLGGHPTEDGGETKFDSVVRADSVRQLSDEGWRALVDYGMKTVVDLRTNEELEADPPAELPVEVRHIPFLETDRSDWKQIEDELDTVVKASYCGSVTHGQRSSATGGRIGIHGRPQSENLAAGRPTVSPVVKYRSWGATESCP